VKVDDYDFLISSANKCLEGLPGLSFVIAKKSEILKLRQRERKSLSLSLWDTYAFLEETDQTPFTPPVQIIYALKKALEEFFKETQAKRHARYVALWERATRGLEKLGFRFLLLPSQQSRLLVAIYEPQHPNYDFEAMHDYLFDRGVTIYPGKTSEFNTFRVATMGALTKDDIDYFLTQISAYLISRKILK